MKRSRTVSRVCGFLLARHAPGSLYLCLNKNCWLCFEKVNTRQEEIEAQFCAPDFRQWHAGANALQIAYKWWGLSSLHSWEGSCLCLAFHLCPWEAPCGAGRCYWSNPIQLQQRLQQLCPLLWPCPRPGWHQSWSWQWLLHVLWEFLGAGLVPLPVKLNEAKCVTCFICY